MRRAKLLIGLLTALCVPSAAARAAGVDAAVAQLTEGARTDAQRATKLLEGAKLMSDQPAAFVALLEKAVEYGTKAAASPEGTAAALEAVALLQQKAPDRKARWDEKRLDLLRLRYRYAARSAKPAAGQAYLAELLLRADATEQARQWPEAAAALTQAYPVAAAVQSPLKEMIAFRRARAAHYQTVGRQVEQTRKLLSADPANAPARRKLVQLLVTELQDPAEAEKLLTSDLDAAWRTYVPLLAKGPGTLAPTAAGELGRWVAEMLAPKTSKYSRIAALKTALACYDRAGDGEKASATALLTRRLAIDKIEKELERIALMSETAGWWGYVDVLRSLELASADKRGVWRVENGALTSWPLARSYLCLPATVTGDYRVSVRFAHRALRAPVRSLLDRFGAGRVGRSSPGMSLALPVGDGHACVTVAPSQRETLVSLFLVAPVAPAGEGEKPAGVLGASGRSGDRGRGGRNGRGGWSSRGGVSGRDGRNDRGGRDSGRSDRGDSRGDWRAALEDTAEKPPADQTVTAKAPAMSLGKAHQVDVAVFVTDGLARIAVQLDGRAVLRWRGQASRCSLTNSWPDSPAARTVLLGGTRGPNAFASVRLAPLTGCVDLGSAKAGP